MKRLIDEPQGPHEERAARMLQTLGPLNVDDAARERVRRALERQAPPTLWLRIPRTAFLGVLAFSASAAALWGGARYVSRAPANETTASEHATPPVTRRATPSSEQTASEVKPEQVPASPANAQPSNAESATSPAPSERPAPNASAGTAHARRLPQAKDDVAPAASDARLVQEAVEALRTRGDAARADELLETYRKKGDPQLAEEALALSIEANLTRKPAKAQSLAREYSSKYPHGRFKSLAERALRSR